jgi:hypothetical protein
MIYQSEFAYSDQPRQREAYRGVGTIKAESQSKEPANCSVTVEAASGIIPDTSICSVHYIT